MSACMARSPTIINSPHTPHSPLPTTHSPLRTPHNSRADVFALAEGHVLAHAHFMFALGRSRLRHTPDECRRFVFEYLGLIHGGGALGVIEKAA